MASKTATMQQLKSAAAKAAVRAASAKEHVRSAKALLKQARKAFKSEKKAAKQARRRVDAAATAATTAAQDRASKATATAAKAPMRAATRKPVRKSAPNPVGNAGRKSASGAASLVPPAPKTRTLKPKAQKPPDTLRSAADVAKSVIERLHSPPPVRVPAAVIPSNSIGTHEPPLPPEAPHRDTPPRDAPDNPSQDSAES